MCNGCGHNNIIQTIVRGTVGITKAIVGIDVTNSDIIHKRVGACQICPFSSKHPYKKSANGLPLIKICSKCNCIISLKVKVNSEKCPEGKW